MLYLKLVCPETIKVFYNKKMLPDFERKTIEEFCQRFT
jgi:hypothetical protein